MKLRSIMLLALALVCAPAIAQVNQGTSPLSVKKGGTGLASGTSGGVLCFTASTTITSSVAATANAIMLGGGASACPSPLGSLGTTTTVLHGNASGPPSFGSVALGTDVSGTLLATNFGALTGDVTNSAGSYATTISANAVTNSKMATMNAWTIKMNNTSGAATPTDTTIDGLTLKASPTSSDEIPIWDAASSAMKKATVSSVASAGSVASINGQTGVVTLLTAPQGRLTLTANTPVMTTSQAAVGTLRYDCYGGNQVPYYTGTADALGTISSCEVTDAMVSAASAGQVVSGQVYDVWWEGNTNHNICIAMSASTGGGGGWASDTGGSNTARGTGYTQLDYVTRPYITNKNAITNCFNAATNYGSIAANKATYLGTIYATANGQTGWVLGAFGAPPTAACLCVFNAYNRVDVATQIGDTVASYTYAVANTWREAHGDTTYIIQIVRGADEDAVTVTNDQLGSIGASTQMSSSIGLDSTTTPSSIATIGFSGSTSFFPILSKYNSTPGLGFHTFAAIESQNTTTASTWFGFSSNAYQTGMSIRTRM